MLKKLLRYDLKAVFKYWWIAAIASLGLSIAGGFAISILSSPKEVPALIGVLVVFMIIFAIIGIAAFPIVSFILTYIRFYKNFFTDEGYLTFTLPVKRSQLLNSKLITSTLALFGSVATLIIDIFVMFAVADTNAFLNDFWRPLVQSFPQLFEGFSAFDYIYFFTAMIEILLLFILSTIFSNLFIFACITFAAIITKKAKVLTAIGIYYVANGIFTGIIQLVYLFGLPTIINWVGKLPDSVISPLVIIMLLAAVLVVALVSLLLYLLNYFMLDRKLNLS